MIDKVLDRKYYDVAYWGCEQVIVNNELKTISLIFSGSNPPETDIPLMASSYNIIPHVIQKLDFVVQFPTADNHIIHYLIPVIKKLDADLSDPPPIALRDLLMLFFWTFLSCVEKQDSYIFLYFLTLTFSASVAQCL
jgi:hypothetical protein